MTVRLAMFDVDGAPIDGQSSIVVWERTFASHAPPPALAVRRIVGAAGAALPGA